MPTPRMSEDPDLERLLLDAGRLQGSSVDSDCPRGTWVLEHLARIPGAALRQDVVEHLAACPSCWEIAWVHHQSLAEDDRRLAGEEKIETAIRQALGRVKGATTLARSRWASWRPLAAAALAASVLFLLMSRTSSAALFDAPVPRLYRLQPDGAGGSSGLRGDRVWLHVDLKAPAFVYVGAAYTLGDRWTFLWLEPAHPGAARRKAPGPIDVRGDLPDGTIEAYWVLLAAPASLDGVELDSLTDSVRLQGFDAARPRGLAGRHGGQCWLQRILPASDDAPMQDLRTEVELVLSRSPDELRMWVASHPKRAAAAVELLLEAGLASPGAQPTSRGFDHAERIASELVEVEARETLLARVATYRRWAGSPEVLEHKRELDRRIRRDLLIHDQSDALLLIDDDFEESAHLYAAAAGEYRRLGDRWGEIESLLRQARFAHPDLMRESLEQVRQMSVQSAYPRGEALALNLLVFIVYQSARSFSLPDEMRQGYESAWDLLEEIRLWEVLAVGRSNFGLELLFRGAVGPAFEHLKEALRVQQRFGFRRDEAYTLYKLALAHAEFGRAEEGLQLGSRGIRLLQECETDHPGHAVVLRPLARSHWATACAALRTGKPDRALELAALGKAVLPRFTPDDPDDRSRLLNIEARAQLALGMQEALVTATQAERACPNPWRQGQALATQGDALAVLGRSEEARDAFGRASRLFASEQERLDLAGALNGEAESLERLSRVEEALEARTSWLETVGELLRFNDRDPNDQAYLRERFLSGFVAGLSLVERLHASEDLRGAAIALRFLEAARPGLGDEPHELVDLGELQAALPPDALWLEYLFGDDRSFVLVADARRARSVTLPVTRREASDIVRELEWAIREEAAPETTSRAGRAAFDALLAPVADRLAGHGLLLVALDPGLEAPLFEAFVDGESPEGGPSYVVDGHAVAYLPSARFLLRMEASPTRDLPPGEFLGLASSSTSGGSREIERIARLFESRGFPTRVLRGSQASTDAVRGGLLAGHRFVHLQAHTFESVALELPASAGSGPDLLEAAEVAGLPELAADLLVLSAGEPADGTDLPGGWGSLPEAFLARGARTVVSQLWSRGACANEELQLRFYTEFLAGQPKAESLRHAKLALLRPVHDVASEEDRSHPFYWASPVLFGASR